MAISASANDGVHAGQRSANLFGVLLVWLIKLLAVMSLALLFSIVIEWIGMALWWPEEGIRHSEKMIAAELSYLTFVSSEQGDVLSRSISTMIRSIQGWMLSILRSAQIQTFMGLSEFLHNYIASAINIMYVFSLRLVVLVLSIPTFIVFGTAGLVRGLAARDKRKWGGGRESSGMFHLYLKLLPYAFIFLWVGYLSMPWSVNPFYFVGPSAVIFACLVSGLAYRMKKYI